MACLRRFAIPLNEMPPAQDVYESHRKIMAAKSSFRVYMNELHICFDKVRALNK